MKFLISAAVVIALLAALVLLSSCASDGSLANNAKPVDKQQTLKATCEGITKADIAFQAFARARPDVIDANGMSVEGAIMASIQPLCTPPYSGDLDAALNSAIRAMVEISGLISKWQTA